MLTLIAAALVTLQSEAAEPVDAPQGAALFAAMGSEREQTLRGCGVDEDELSRLIGLGPRAFDQDMQGGWRPYADTPGCERAAADLIIVYISHSPHYDPQSHAIIRWHAGQMLATADERELAVEYLDSTRSSHLAWNLYVDATIAFLRSDREAAEAARAELAGQLPSEAEMESRRQFLANNPRITMPEGFVERPQNLDVVDSFLACWGRPYSEAYGQRCEAAGGD
ncbi:MAG: hypothetical protein ACXIVL_09205 [Oceanicaulis sp.]